MIDDREDRGIQKEKWWKMEMDIRRIQDKGKQNCAVLWYNQPACDWNEALPIGNGRIGGMVFGNIGCEQIQVNEDTVWYGGSMDRNNPSAKEKLPFIRELIKKGKIGGSFDRLQF